jgi:hypothetical protein
VLSTTAGLHVPVMPLSEFEGNRGTAAPLHIVSDVPKLKMGVVFGVMVTSKVVAVAH